MQLNILGRVIVGLNTHFYVDVDLRRLQSYPVQINTLNALFLSLSLFVSLRIVVFLFRIGECNSRRRTVPQQLN